MLIVKVNVPDVVRGLIGLKPSIESMSDIIDRDMILLPIVAFILIEFSAEIAQNRGTHIKSIEVPNFSAPSQEPLITPLTRSNRCVILTTL